MYAYRCDVRLVPGTLVNVAEGAVTVCVRVGVVVAVLATCKASSYPLRLALASAWTAKIPREPGMPIPRIKRIARIEWRFLARMTPTYERAGWSPFSMSVTGQQAEWLCVNHR